MFARSICAVVACGFTLPAVAARVVYLAEQDYAFVSELYVGDLDRPGESVKLNKPLPWFAEGVGSFAVSPDGSKIVFSADRQTGEDTDLCLVDIAMPGALTRLGNLPSGWLEGFAKFSPDGGKIAFTASDEMFANTQLYLVDLATPGSATRMNGDLAIHGAVSKFGFEFTADGSHLVYVAGELEKKFELYAVALDRPGQSVRLNAPGGSVGDTYGGRFRILPDSRHVVYSAVWQHPGQREAHIVSLDAPGQPTTLNAPFAPGGYLQEFAVSPDGLHVAYVADAETASVNEAYLVATAAPGTARKISTAVQYGAGQLQFTADGRYVVFAADSASTASKRDLYMVPVDGSFAALALNAPRDAGADVGTYSLSADGNQIVYSIVAQDGFARDMLVGRLDAPGSAMKLNGPLPDGALEFFPAPQFSPDGTQVAFIAVESLDTSIQQLFMATVSAPGTSVRVNRPLAPDGIVPPHPGSFTFLPAGAPPTGSVVPPTGSAVPPAVADTPQPSSGGGALGWPGLLLLLAASRRRLVELLGPSRIDASRSAHPGDSTGSVRHPVDATADITSLIKPQFLQPFRPLLQRTFNILQLHHVFFGSGAEQHAQVDKAVLAAEEQTCSQRPRGHSGSARGLSGRDWVRLPAPAGSCISSRKLWGCWPASPLTPAALSLAKSSSPRSGTDAW